MKNNMLCLCLNLILVSSFSYAQKVDPKHENHYRAIQTISTPELDIDFDDQHSQMEFTKMRIKFKNKTDDYIVVKFNETVFKYEHGDYSPKDKTFIIDPRESKSKTLAVTGDNRFHVDNFDLYIKGIYKASVNGTTQTAVNFKIPKEADSFSAGSFRCEIKGDIKKTTAITDASFKCTYHGSDLGMINPYKLKIKLEDGQLFPNVDKGIKLALLEPNDSEKFKTIFEIDRHIIDMQFANMEIVWNETFVESKLERLADIPVIKFEIDPGKTAGKNK